MALLNVQQAAGGLSSSSALSLTHAAGCQLVELSLHTVSLAWLLHSPTSPSTNSAALVTQQGLLSLTPPPTAQSPLYTEGVGGHLW